MTIRDFLHRRKNFTLIFSSVFSIALCGGLLTGCDNLSTPGSGEGEIRMHMVDAPADVEAVMIVVSRVDVHTAGSGEADGWVTVSDTPASYDLLSLRNGSSALLANATLRAGLYTQIRLILGAGSYVVIDGVPVELEVASGFETGIKLNHQFVIEEDQTYEITLDFDAGRSIRPIGLLYRLQPVIRIVVNQTSGSISGFVLPAEARATVMVMASVDTLSTTACDTTNGYFKFPAVPEGTYDLHVSATAGLFRDTVVTNVAVTRQNETSVGNVMLSAGVSP